MFHPTRGGTRGGAAEFKWSDVKADKDRENYLGHSINAPAGRWQNGKDIRWFEKDKSEADQDKRREELRRVKEAEQLALNEKLGLTMDKIGPVTVGDALLAGAAGRSSHSASATGANRSLSQGVRQWGGDAATSAEPSDGLTSEERKAAKRLAKLEVKEKRKEEKDKIRKEREQRRAERARRDGRGDDRDRDRDQRQESSRHQHLSLSREDGGDPTRHRHRSSRDVPGHEDHDRRQSKFRSRSPPRHPYARDSETRGADGGGNERRYYSGRSPSPYNQSRRSPGRSLSPPLRRSR